MSERVISVSPPARRLVLGGQDHVDLTPREHRLQPRGVGGHQLHAHAREVGVEPLKHLRNRGIDDVMGHAQRDLAGVIGRGQPPQNLVVQVQETPCVAQHLLPRPGERQPPRAAVEQRHADAFLQPLELHRHGRLREVQEPRRLGHAAGIHDGDEGTHSGQVEIAGHIITIRDSFHQNHSLSI
jgi:hypothetical protein